jgi:hypothetical protein
MKFSNWVNWSNRNSLAEIKFPGIYCISVIESDISNHLFQFIPEINYIGMTNSKGGLKSRLNQFDNTLKNRLQHGGADRFMHKFNEPYGELVQKMFVSIWSFECEVDSNKYEDLITMGEVAKSEYICFAEYVKIFKELPEFNKKESPKASKQKK